MTANTKLDGVKEMLGYSDTQWQSWQANPRNLQVVENFGAFQKYKIVAEVRVEPA